MSESFAHFLQNIGDTNGALKVLNDFLFFDATDPKINEALGVLYWQKGNISQAIKFRRIAEKRFRERGNYNRAGKIHAWLKNIAPQNDSPKSILSPSPSLIKKKTELNREPPKITPVKPKLKQVPSSQPPVQKKKSQKAQPPLIIDIKTLPRPEPLPFGRKALLMTGSGVIIGSGKYVLTNRHVVENEKNTVVRSGTGELRYVDGVRFSKTDDLALLKLKEPFPKVYSLSVKKIKKGFPGRRVILIGFPLGDIMGLQQPSLTEGVISRNTGILDNTKHFVITAKMNKGNSGGPIFDNNGSLMGIAVQKLSKKKIFDRDGVIVEDVNFAIRSDRIKSFLNIANFEERKEELPKYSFEDIYKIMLPRVVLIVSEKK
ncbi:MAG: hypothetical protein CMM44_06500 [Rhodospirillaceae bacterium]|nr:hypothetical protein [Rhodospirillaceae bacterium]